MEIAETYIRLAHAIDHHVPGFIDGYGGPPEWADRSERPAAELLNRAAELVAQVQAMPEGARRTYLLAQTRAMHTQARVRAGEGLSYLEQVRGQYDIEPEPEPEATFNAALGELDAALPGHGDLGEREQTLRDRVTVPRGDILRVAGAILDGLRARTKAAFGLPDGENFSIGLVNDKPWGGYNWPLGNYQSRIDINTDLPTILPALPDLLAHEGYPGHHTEHALKEQHLARGQGWHEFEIQLLHAPECVVSEGLATRALAAVMEPAEVETWLRDTLSPLAGLDSEDVAAFLHATRAKEQLGKVMGNAALLLHEQGRPEPEVLEYLRHYGARTEAQARKNMEFLKAPASRTYVFTYSVGADLLDGLFETRDRQAWFKRLLTEPTTPGMIRGWITTGGA